MVEELKADDAGMNSPKQKGIDVGVVFANKTGKPFFVKNLDIKKTTVADLQQKIFQVTGFTPNYFKAMLF